VYCSVYFLVDFVNLQFVTSSVAERSLPLLNLVELLYQPHAPVLLSRWGQLQDHLHKAQRLKNGKAAPSVDNTMRAMGAQLLKGNRLARLVGKASSRLCVGPPAANTGKCTVDGVTEIITLWPRQERLSNSWKINGCIGAHGMRFLAIFC
jgi:hypothetical protein